MQNIDRLKIHAFIKNSRANGPGLRAVLWTQGCTLGCPGCFNPETHSRHGGEWVGVSDLAERILSIEGIEGLTISGGEPLQQISPLTGLVKLLHKTTDLSVVVFSGFEADEIYRMPGHEALLSQIDVLVAGRYRQEERLATGLRGSSNKQLIFLTSRYSKADFESLPEAEIIIDADGQVIYSGIDPIQ
jgi:anaerobic ribonucleoside-triphosphate reductase activating protein